MVIDPTLVDSSAHRSRPWPGSITGVRTDSPHVVLTFDDGPQPGGTDKVLAVLDELDATATFFVLASRARRFGGLLAEVGASSHDIGLHGLDHRRLTAFPPDVVQRRTAEAKAELEDLTGRAIVWVRPPYGAQTAETWHAMSSCGLVPVLWGPTLNDWLHVSDADRVAAASQDARPGSILLAHDGFAGSEDGAYDGPEPDVDRGALLRRLLQTYGHMGLVGRSLSDALVDGTEVREARFPL